MKEHHEFDKHSYSRDGYKSECKSCRRIYNKGAYNAVKDTPKQKRANFRNAIVTKYKLTVEEYEALVVKQNGVCAICLKPPVPNRRSKRLHIDHCHETNQVRGLLCIHCNLAIASLGDNLTGLMRAVRYLQRAGDQIVN